MKPVFDIIQKEHYQSAEEKRFYWQTQNPYIKEKECLLLSSIKDFIGPNDTILEVGCGEGANIFNLLSLGVNNSFTGVDFSSQKIDFCTKLNLNNATFYCSDARSLPFENNQFDVVYIRDLLHHVNEDRELVIKELIRVTKLNGTIVIIEANIGKLTNWVFASIFKHEMGLKDSSQKKIQLLLKDYQYKLTSLEPSNFFRFLLHYNLGMPYLAKFKPICFFLDIIENIYKHIIPQNGWAYWLIILNKLPTNV